MNPQSLRIRRATVDDVDALKKIWVEMRFSPDDLEKRLTEFQVVENPEGAVLGAIGFQVSAQHALLFCEGYSDFSVADSARDLFWERMQKLASNHGVFRVWTQEQSPFWKNLGFQHAPEDTLAQLPEKWKSEFEGGWDTIQLKDEERINAALQKEMKSLLETGKLHDARLLDHARTVKNIISVIAFVIGFLCIGMAVYLLLRRGGILTLHR